MEKGDRVKLVRCGDTRTKLKPGDQGTYVGYSYQSGHAVDWDNGSKLSMLPEQGDQIELVAGLHEYREFDIVLVDDEEIGPIMQGLLEEVEASISGSKSMWWQSVDLDTQWPTVRVFGEPARLEEFGKLIDDIAPEDE